MICTFNQNFHKQLKLDLWENCTISYLITITITIFCRAHALNFLFFSPTHMQISRDNNYFDARALSFFAIFPYISGSLAMTFLAFAKRTFFYACVGKTLLLPDVRSLTYPLDLDALTPQVCVIQFPYSVDFFRLVGRIQICHKISSDHLAGYFFHPATQPECII